MRVIFLLVKPENPANVGAACRAMKTMGHNELRMVDPCEYLTLRGRALAHGSEEILEAAKVYDSFEKAADDCDLVIGTTARHRKIKLDYIDSNLIMDTILSKQEKVNSVCFVFGGERNGLSTEHLHACDLVCTIPTATTFPSLNLSQSVMLFSYITRTPMAKVQTQDWRINNEQPDKEHFRAIKTSLSKLIDDLEMKDPTKLKHKILAAIARLGAEDLNLVHSVRRRVQNRIDNLKRGL